MPPFNFRLQPIRRLREARRDELRGQLADAHRAAEVLADQRRQIADELADIRRLQGDAAKRRLLNVNQMMESQRYALVLEGQEAALREKAKLVESEIERRRQAVVEAEREVKALDKLEEKQRLKHQHESQRLEAKLLDEVAVTGFRFRAAGEGN
ncbi:MAG: flagellar export protein FliJ [Planctomycetales bacterium]|nr:flagellar export protein FliJ [Planctomycetales bacterium]